MSLADLRKELRDLRKDAVKPVSKMKKSDVAREIERLRGSHKKEEKEEKVEHRKEEKEVKKVMKEAPKKVAEKVVEVQKKEHKKQEETTKKMHKEEERKEVPKEDMSEKMARLRAMRKSKKEE